MGGGGPRLVGAAVADDGATDDKAGVGSLVLGHADGGVDVPGVHAVYGADDVPPVGLEPLGHVLGEGDVGVPLDGDVVVVVEVDELAQSQGARQACGL